MPTGPATSSGQGRLGRQRHQVEIPPARRAQLPQQERQMTGVVVRLDGNDAFDEALDPEWQPDVCPATPQPRARGRARAGETASPVRIDAAAMLLRAAKAGRRRANSGTAAPITTVTRSPRGRCARRGQSVRRRRDVAGSARDAPRAPHVRAPAAHTAAPHRHATASTKPQPAKNGIAENFDPTANPAVTPKKHRIPPARTIQPTLQGIQRQQHRRRRGHVECRHRRMPQHRRHRRQQQHGQQRLARGPRQAPRPSQWTTTATPETAASPSAPGQTKVVMPARIENIDAFLHAIRRRCAEGVARRQGTAPGP